MMVQNGHDVVCTKGLKVWNWIGYLQTKLMYAYHHLFHYLIWSLYQILLDMDVIIFFYLDCSFIVMFLMRISFDIVAKFLSAQLCAIPHTRVVNILQATICY
jgi:cellulose synthase/poly-beta-1,6-N-acetylglucosamine synthase-like glycosyltransferase